MDWNHRLRAGPLQRICHWSSLLNFETHFGGMVLKFRREDHLLFINCAHAILPQISRRVGQQYRYKVLPGWMREWICEIIMPTCAEMGSMSCKVCWPETMCICSCRYRQSWPCPTSCSASKAARRDGSRWSSLSCASATGEDAFGPEVISQPPLEMSLTISSRSNWNYIPLNNANGASR